MQQLIDFMNDFRRDYGVQLDPVYTGKMMYGIFDLMRTEVLRKYSYFSRSYGRFAGHSRHE